MEIIDTNTDPNKSDTKRGKWSSSSDFYFACVSHAFSINFFSIIPIAMYQKGLEFFLSFLLNLFFFNIPIFFIQSYLGQFSSSGFISVFRIAPLFKGIGYFILILNFTSVTYLSVQAGLSLKYALDSLKQSMPWMNCDEQMIKPDYFTLKNDTYNGTLTKTGNCLVTIDSCKKYFLETVGINFISNEFNLSWEILAFMIIVWIAVAAILSTSTEKFGKILRWTCIAMFVLLFVIFVRTLFLPQTWRNFKRLFSVKRIFAIDRDSLLIQTLLGFLMMGTGWGSVITLASYNKFKTNIYKSSLTVNGSIFGVIMITGLTSFNLQTFASDVGFYTITNVFQMYPYTLGNIGLPNLWTFIFFVLLFLCEVCAIVIQTFGILTALFDEFKQLRQHKLVLTYALISILIIPSTLFCTNHGYKLIHLLGRYEAFTQMCLCLLTLIVVLWIYNQPQFQKDVQFMVSRTFETWKIYIMRTGPAVYILIFLFTGALFIDIDTHHLKLSWRVFGFCLTMISFLIIPIYIIVKILKASGPIAMRFKQMCQPDNWYPADENDKRRYEATFGDFSETLMDELL